MPDLILHHYPTSPFAEKVRLMLGHKGLAWRSVHIPAILPKPDVVALTGGYRKTPFLQIGADVYCDSALIARVLDQVQPAPLLHPVTGEAAGLAPLLAQWADSSLFWTAVPYAMQPLGAPHILGTQPEVLKAFAADRAAFSAGTPRQTLADATVVLQQYLQRLEALLSDGRAFLCGATATIADFSVVHPLWFIHRAPPLHAGFDPYPALRAWYQRMAAIGHGQPSAMDSGEALQVAAGAGGHAPVQVQPGLGFEPGQEVTVAATDYGRDPVAGVLVGLDGQSVTLARQDERAGQVHVHFPRTGFQIKKPIKE